MLRKCYARGQPGRLSVRPEVRVSPPPQGRGAGLSDPWQGGGAGLRAYSLLLALKDALGTLAEPIRQLEGADRTQMTQDVPYEQISATLGSLLFLWANIERQARKDLAQANGGEVPKSAHDIDAALKAWVKLQCEAAHSEGSLRPELALAILAQLKRHLDVRNGFCHGLLGASAGYHEQQAHLILELNGLKNRITWDELQATFSSLSKVRRAMDMIGSEGQGKVTGGLRNADQNRAWWRSEFGIGITDSEDAMLTSST